ncbi:MAG TPA: hypothetical protein VN947_08075 [Polyangia bacterium]|nr:hypothetical protein [Polyangia bacterium]
MTRLTLVLLVIASLTVGCGVHCERDGCAEHPRECRVEWGFACPSCAGKVEVCAARTREELATLDEEKRRCPSKDFSYQLGCICAGKPCFTEKQRCENRGGKWVESGVMIDCIFERQVRP